MLKVGNLVDNINVGTIADQLKHIGVSEYKFDDDCGRYSAEVEFTMLADKYMLAYIKISIDAESKEYKIFEVVSSDTYEKEIRSILASIVDILVLNIAL